MRDMNKKNLYEVHEISKKAHEVYPVWMSENELKDFLKAKSDCYGYIPGVGGDKSYSCWAVLMRA